MLAKIAGNTTFVRAIDEVLNEVEASTGAAALVTTSADAKFFSNGLDLDWVQAPDDYPAAGDRTAFGPEFMGLMSPDHDLPHANGLRGERPRVWGGLHVSTLSRCAIHAGRSRFHVCQRTANWTVHTQPGISSVQAQAARIRIF